MRQVSCNAVLTAVGTYPGVIGLRNFIRKKHLPGSSDLGGMLTPQWEVLQSFG